MQNNAKKYYCKNGETVLVTININTPYIITVSYNGKKYKRPISCIGKTIFPNNPLAVCINSKVTLFDITNNEQSVVKIIPVNYKTKYTRMGGSYYGAGTELIRDSDAGQLEDNTMLITDDSPLGKAIMNKKKNDIISFDIEEHKIEYKILEIDNSFMIK